MRLLVLSLLLAACAGGGTSDPDPARAVPAPASPAPASPAPDDLALTTDQSAYAPGATAAVTFRNGTPETVSLAQPLDCAALEREVTDGWARVPSDRMCTSVLVPVAAGGAQSARLAVPERAGTYRFSQVAYVGSERAEVASGPFTVR